MADQEITVPETTKNSGSSYAEVLRAEPNVFVSTPYVNVNLVAWYNALAVKPTQGLLDDLNDMMDSIPQASFDEADLFHPIAGLETEEQRLKPIKSTSGLDFVKVGTGTLDASGWQGNGTDGYLNLRWQPSTNGVKYLLNNAMYAFHIATNNVNLGCPLGAYDGTQYCEQFLRFDAGNTGLFAINQFTDQAIACPDSSGYWRVQRTGASGAGSSAIYRNGGLVSTSSLASVGLPTRPCFYGARNLSGVADSFSNRLMRGIEIGSSTCDLRTYLQAFFTARGL